MSYPFKGIKARRRGWTRLMRLGVRLPWADMDSDRHCTLEPVSIPARADLKRIVKLPGHLYLAYPWQSPPQNGLGRVSLDGGFLG